MQEAKGREEMARTEATIRADGKRERGKGKEARRIRGSFVAAVVKVWMKLQIARGPRCAGGTHRPNTNRGTVPTSRGRAADTTKSGTWRGCVGRNDDFD